MLFLLGEIINTVPDANGGKNAEACGYDNAVIIIWVCANENEDYAKAQHTDLNYSFGCHFCTPFRFADSYTYII